ncbi:MAG: ABC transporter permease [Spirochaetaceae bacterium]
MTNEPNLIMKRRFTGRILESGLLIIAVALGVGAAASGLSLLFHTNEYSKKLLASPEYREVVVTTRADMEDMEFPVIEKISEKEVRLGTQDLKAGELMPSISFSYITAGSRIGFMTTEVLESKNVPQRGPGRNRDNEDNKDEVSDFEKMVETFEKAADSPDYIIPEVEEISGYQVSSQFFNAMDMDTSYGSFFTSKDYTTNNNFIILGSEIAELLAGSKYELSELTGKKIISWESLYTVIGILQPTGTDMDDQFYSPVKQLTENGRFRGRGMGSSNLRYSVTNVEDLDNTVTMLTQWFDTAYGVGQVSISNPRAEATRLVSRNRGISILILFLSLAGLFIASVNVSNILMSRSLRMKKHVGILKALGASKKSIIKLFATEALIITLIGSILGAGLAIPLSMAMESSLGLGDVSWLYILIGVVLSSILTLLFSVIPARQNSGIEAATAMRSAG